jgi:hypothetical protein
MIEVKTNQLLPGDLAIMPGWPSNRRHILIVSVDNHYGYVNLHYLTQGKLCFVDRHPIHPIWNIIRDESC